MRRIASYQLGKTTILYYKNPNGGCEWIIVPTEKKTVINLPERIKFDSLVQAKLMGDDFPKGFVTGSTMRNSATVQGLSYETQNIQKLGNGQVEICTTLKDIHGNSYEHILKGQSDGDVFETYVRFLNTTNQKQTLEMLSTFSLSNLSPFNTRNKVGNILITRYQSKWSFEGRKEQRPIEEYQLEPSWKPSGVGLEKIGQIGSMPVRNYFPTAAITDVAENVTWGVRLAHPGSWQAEFYRLDEDLCFSGGIADRDYGDWSKTLKPGESYQTPSAFITVCIGSEEECGNQFNNYFSDLVTQYGHESEESMSVMFNEFCTTWGKPSEESVTAAIPILQQHDIDYYIIDCGWYADAVKGWEKNMGDWIPNPQQFPNGVRPVIEHIQASGMLPGIWFEIETVGRDAIAFSLVDHLLKKDGIPITTGDRRFWNMNDPWVISYLSERVIDFLKETKVGYLKIDYNDNFGVGFDGEDSFGEENRKQLEGTQRFFEKIRKELPDLIIENCSSGGHRLEPSLMMRTDLSSFSDAHESLCIPIIGANMHELIPPRQNLMWAVLRKEDSLKRIYYSLTANFLGRLCLSGDITELSKYQWEAVDEGIAFYRRVSSIIKSGYSRRFGKRVLSYRDPEGSQAVIRYAKDGSEALLVLHGFKKAEKVIVSIEGDYEIIDCYGSPIGIEKINGGYECCFTEDFQGTAFYLQSK
ncbi:glycoside hydrolase family 36 protein [Enterococcus sp. OL5]|uniref:glycoside hydrolase family 36 protein n=1 Tax=Enterococcus sp. OL5 TaxID=2590214 RepID=UPI00112CC4D7|nr:glycoside hydrolase family 36 protein [Enterococcus sp. OL5]TPR56869.1 alpha-galactosidase [Enterococcus sp. OL5]